MCYIALLHIGLGIEPTFFIAGHGSTIINHLSDPSEQLNEQEALLLVQHFQHFNQRESKV
jgi:hypothetical protein